MNENENLLLFFPLSVEKPLPWAMEHWRELIGNDALCDSLASGMPFYMPDGITYNGANIGKTYWYGGLNITHQRFIVILTPIPTDIAIAVMMGPPVQEKKEVVN